MILPPGFIKCPDCNIEIARSELSDHMMAHELEKNYEAILRNYEEANRNADRIVAVQQRVYEARNRMNQV